jgi:hypothetical protein
MGSQREKNIRAMLRGDANIERAPIINQISVRRVQRRASTGSQQVNSLQPGSSGLHRHQAQKAVHLTDVGSLRRE